MMRIKIKINLEFFFKSALQVRNSAALKFKMAGEAAYFFVILQLWFLVNVIVQGSLPYGPLLVK